MANYIITNDGLVNADELMHWKYIKKIPNGKGGYRYIYDASELKKAEIGQNVAKTAYGLAKADRDKDYVVKNGKRTTMRIATSSAQSKMYDAKDKRLAENEKKYKAAKRKYQKEKVQSTLAKGAYKVGKYLKKLASK